MFHDVLKPEWTQGYSHKFASAVHVESLHFGTTQRRAKI